MSAARTVKTILNAAKSFVRGPRDGVHTLSDGLLRRRAAAVAGSWDTSQGADTRAHVDVANPLREYFDSIKEGPGVWKWLHYFDVYHRHLQRFVGREVVVVEVGVYSGGSLPMWRHYFGPASQIHGIDIEARCRVYAAERIAIHIGDQADRSFWRRFREAVPVVDVLIDDGGHEAHQQRVTLEEMLPHVQPGGVYICEDVVGVGNGFSAFVHSLSDNLNALSATTKAGGVAGPATSFQSAIDSVHFYPFVAVIEKRAQPMPQLAAPKHGTQWQPFL